MIQIITARVLSEKKKRFFISFSPPRNTSPSNHSINLRAKCRAIKRVTLFLFKIPSQIRSRDFDFISQFKQRRRRRQQWRHSTTLFLGRSRRWLRWWSWVRATRIASPPPPPSTPSRTITCLFTLSWWVRFNSQKFLANFFDFSPVCVGYGSWSCVGYAIMVVLGFFDLEVILVSVDLMTSALFRFVLLWAQFHGKSWELVHFDVKLLCLLPWIWDITG